MAHLLCTCAIDSRNEAGYKREKQRDTGSGEGRKRRKGRLFVWYAGSSSGLISYDNDIQTENIGARIDEDLGSGRHFPTQRTISGETRLSINLCAPLYFSSSSAGDRRYLVLPAIRIGCLQVWGHALHAGHPVTRSPLENTKHHSSTSNTISITFAQRRSAQSVKRVVRHDRVCGAIW